MSDDLRQALHAILRAPGKAVCWGQPTPDDTTHEGGRGAAEAPTPKRAKVKAARKQSQKGRKK